MSTPTQHGNKALQSNAPDFDSDGYVVDAGTWRERDNTDHEMTVDEASEPWNDTFNSPGVDATCTWSIKHGSTAAVKGTVVTDSGQSPARKFLVLEVENFNYGGRTLKQNVTLRYKAGYDPTVTA